MTVPLLYTRDDRREDDGSLSVDKKLSILLTIDG